MGLLQEGTAKRGIPRRARTATTDRLVSVAAVLLVCIFLGGYSVNARFGFPPKTRLTWVNGIGYNTGHMEREAPMIAKYFGGKKVEFYHNPTKMVDEKDTRGYVSDLTQAGQQKYLGKITSEVNGLVEHLKAAVRSVEKQNGIVVHIAHSQGALVTCLAAKQLTPVEMNRIEVISFGGATPVRSTPETPFRRCVNYYSVNDPLLFLNPSAESALRSGFSHYYSSTSSNNQNAKNEEEFCFLAPRVGDPIADHMLLGPTYASALEWEGKRFERKYQTYLKRTVRFALLTSLSIFTTIFQLLSLILQKLVTVLSELRIRLRRALVRSLVAKIHAIRSLIVALLAQIIAFVRGLWYRSNTTEATTATTTTIDPDESRSQPPPSEASILKSSSDSAYSSSKVTATTDPIVKQQASFFGFRRTPKIEASTIPEMETVSKPAEMKSRWMPSKNEKQLR